MLVESLKDTRTFVESICNNRLHKTHCGSQRLHKLS